MTWMRAESKTFEELGAAVNLRLKTHSSVGLGDTGDMGAVSCFQEFEGLSL